MDSELLFATQLAKETGKLLADHFSPNGTQTNLKEDYSVVTEADLSADHLITESIRVQYPNDGLISEELQPNIENSQSAVWVVDPLDGTTNFSLGLPIWGISIARIVNGWPQIGVAYFPLLNEMYSASQGGGAFLNRHPIHSQPPVPGQPNSFFSCCTRTHQYYDVSVRYKTRILGAASYTLCAVARGMAVVGFEATPKIWDIAAGWLIATESGAAVETRDGSQPFPLRDNFDYRTRSFPIVVGANEALLKRSREQIMPKQQKNK